MRRYLAFLSAIALALVSCFEPALTQGLSGPSANSPGNPTGGGFQAYIPAALGNIGSHWAPVGGAAPTVTAGCNGAGLVVDPMATDTACLITGQTAAATTCTLTFGNPYTLWVYCVASGQQSALTAVTPSLTTLVVTFASTANFKWNYICLGK